MAAAIPRWSAVTLTLLALGAGAAPYADPDGAFALDLPAGWSADRQVLPDLGVMTRFGPAGDKSNPFAVFVATATRDIGADELNGVAEHLLGLVVGALADGGQVLSQTSSAARFADRPAVCGEATHRPTGEPGSYAVKVHVVTHGRWAYAVMANVPAGDSAAMARLDAVGATLALGSRVPVAPRGATNPARLGAARPPAEVLVPGDPPLTVGSVMHFASLLAHLFDVQLTEAEFQTTLRQFESDYRGADAAGKKVIATSAGDILAALRRGTAEEQARNKGTVQAIFRQQLQEDSRAGHAWAQVLWTAITRREQTVARTAAQPTAQAPDTALSEADLDAAVELLHFMWVASGRDPSHVTPEHLAEARAFLAQSFPRLPQDFQLLLANAQTVYGRVRGAWQQADAATRAALARQFEGALNELGLKNPAAMTTGGAWDDVDPSTVTADLVQVTCYNLAQKSTGGAWP